MRQKPLHLLFSLLLSGVLAFDVRRLQVRRNVHRRHFLSQLEPRESEHHGTTIDFGLGGRIASSCDERSDALPPVLQSIVDERREFQLNLGRAMDTLRRDMQEILSRKPDFSIYHKDIKIVDPSGVQLKGLDKYRSAITFMQTFVSFWFHDRASIQFRMVYDSCRSCIRISWNVVLVPKVPLGRPLHVDGISYYQMDAATGKVVEHRIEKLIINNTPVAPPYGILSLLQQDALRLLQPQGVPVGIGALARQE